MLAHSTPSHTRTFPPLSGDHFMVPACVASSQSIASVPSCNPCVTPRLVAETSPNVCEPSLLLFTAIASRSARSCSTFSSEANSFFPWTVTCHGIAEH